MRIELCAECAVSRARSVSTKLRILQLAQIRGISVKGYGLVKSFHLNIRQISAEVGRVRVRSTKP